MTTERNSMTVADLRAALDKFPDDLRVVVWDADTDWALPLSEVLTEKDWDETETEPLVVLRSVGYN